MSNFKNMDRWLGDGGMPVIEAIGAAFDSYGPDAGGWAGGTWVPTALACNPHGVVQAGVHAIVLDAAINFAVNAGLEGRDRTHATLEIKCEYPRGARQGDRLRLRGEVVRTTRQVAWGVAEIRDEEDRLVSKATATFLLRREDVTAPS